MTEPPIDKYEPQSTQRITIVSGQTATVNFKNVLKRGDLEVTKTSEDGLVSGDECCQNSYPIGYHEIYGYGTPAY